MNENFMIFKELLEHFEFLGILNQNEESEAKRQKITTQILKVTSFLIEMQKLNVTYCIPPNQSTNNTEQEIIQFLIDNSLNIFKLKFDDKSQTRFFCDIDDIQKNIINSSLATYELCKNLNITLALPNVVKKMVNDDEFETPNININQKKKTLS